MKKSLFALFIVLMFVVTCAQAAPVSASEYDLFTMGRITFTVEVPEDFNEIVFVSLMDDEGGVQQFPILAESDYKLVENVVSGPYHVSGFVDNDPWFEYTVLREQDIITVSGDTDIAVKLTVVKGAAGEIVEETAPMDPPVADDETEAFETIFEDEPTEPEDSVPSTDAEDVPDETEDSTEHSGNEEQDPTEPPAEEEDKPFWQKLLVSVIVSLAFALAVIAIVYAVRHYFGDE